jgi:hypothetical protein
LFTNTGKAMSNDQALQLAQVLATLALVDVLDNIYVGGVSHMPGGWVRHGSLVRRSAWPLFRATLR